PCGDVTLKQVTELATIKIATDWELGEKLAGSGKDHFQTGFIGQGFSKRAIYVRARDKEYAITQPRTQDEPGELVKSTLGTKLRLVHKCHWFKERFNDFTKDSDVNPPNFRFHAGSFLGELFELTDDTPILPYRTFLASPLLPCSKFDAPLRKFTGNDTIGKPEDDIARVIHAFVHFSLIYSHNQWMPCDLQG
ncbi:hypothetical protein BDN72DRAFT_733173, partial [Pluteus cervinus]